VAFKTSVITQPALEEFLLEHHLWGACRAKHKYGLFHKRTGELMASQLASQRTGLACG